MTLSAKVGQLSEKQKLEFYLSKRKLAQFKLILKELLVRGKNFRFLPLNNTLRMQFINSKPEIRFRVSRPRVRKIIRRMIKQELWRMQKPKEDIKMSPFVKRNEQRAAPTE